MLDRFKEYLSTHLSIPENNRILLAVSGGIDSVVMTDLFYRLQFDCIIAHCNFSLRNEESDQDEAFVRDMAEQYNFPFHSQTFNTQEYAEQNNISIQMAARDLRYEWFEELRVETSCELIATAHNKNDSVETFFINLTRGTGLRGLTGIGRKKDLIIRPLLWAEREEISAYAEATGLSWREDSSNLTIKYLRNAIRHKILPEFKNLNSSFLNIMEDNIFKLKLYERLINSVIQTKKEEIFKPKGLVNFIYIPSILELDPPELWLYEFLRDYDFTFETILDILNSLESNSGKLFFSPTHRIVKDRDHLILEPYIEKSASDQRFYIENAYTDIDHPIPLCLKVVPKNKEFKIIPESKIAYFDLDKIDFPLLLRKWEQGDYFMPLGMNNMKKLSDFFIDRKRSIPEKEKTWLLCSGKNIIWVVGERIDERYKVTEETGKVLVIENLTYPRQ